MPLAVIHYDPKKINKTRIVVLAKVLIEAIAHALTIPGHPHASLKIDDTEVRFSEYNAQRDYNHPDVGIQIFANEYPERRADLEKRNALIVKTIKDSGVLSDEAGSVTAYVWTMLFPAAFETF